MGRAAFLEHGFVTVAELVDAETVQTWLELRTRQAERMGLDEGASMVTFRVSEAPTVATDPRLTGAAERVLGGPVEAFGVTFLTKPPVTGLPALWHQDGHPWADRLQGAAACTVWVALDDTDGGNGCLRVIPGSHQLAPQPMRPAPEPPNLFGVQMDPELVDDSAAVEVPLPAGGACVHHPALIHGSGPNRSGRPRRALAARFLRTD